MVALLNDGGAGQPDGHEVGRIKDYTGLHTKELRRMAEKSQPGILLHSLAGMVRTLEGSVWRPHRQ